jgi:hypothetical protein
VSGFSHKRLWKDLALVWHEACRKHRGWPWHGETSQTSLRWNPQMGHSKLICGDIAGTCWDPWNLISGSRSNFGDGVRTNWLPNLPLIINSIPLAALASLANHAQLNKRPCHWISLPNVYCSYFRSCKRGWLLGPKNLLWLNYHNSPPWNKAILGWFLTPSARCNFQPGGTEYLLLPHW